MDGFGAHDPQADRRMAASTLAAWLPQVALYPLRGHCAPVILLVALLLGIGGSSITALVPLIVGSLWTAHYAVRVIETTSYGHATPPRLTGDALSLTDGFTWSALVAPALLLVLHLEGARIAVWVLAALLPAHWIVLATTRSLVAASHPAQLVSAIGATGAVYAAVCAMLVGAALIGDWMSRHVPGFLLIGTWLYLLFAGCHLLGFVAYQRHERLGIGVQVERPTVAREREAEQARRLDVLLGEIAALHAAGQDEAAAQRMRDTLPGPADARRFHEELYDRLKSIPARGLALTQAARMIAFLIDRRLLDRALEIHENALDLDSRFRAESVLHLRPLAERALETRQAALLSRLLDCAQASFAGDAALRLLDSLRIRLHLELERDEVAARAALEALGNLDGHPNAAELRTYARVLAIGGGRPRRPGPGDPSGADRSE